MVAFDHLILLTLLILIPVCIVLFLLMLRWKKNTMHTFGDADVVQRILTDYSPARPIVKFVLLMLTLTMLVFAVVNMKIGSKMSSVKRKGLDIIIALDISNSMLAQDIKPSRIVRSQMAISKLIDKFEDDQIGIIVFAGKAQVLLPVTTDYAAAKMLVSEANPDIIQAQGTAIGDAINLARVSFDKNSKNKKVIIVISDGENHEDDAIEAARAAASDGLQTYTIGIGSAAGAPIPVNMSGFNIEYKKDNSGNTVVTKLNETMLQQVAAAGKGTYVRATTNDAGLNKVFDEINKLEKKEYEARVFSEYRNTYMYFIIAALLLLIADLIILERKTKLTRNVHLFSKKHIIS
ncbi:MAG TPA: VWA domain-containing protein [Bacteroidales bacterium]|nr:VWA domain-containing protein [Bacteroidales bacterium]